MVPKVDPVRSNEFERKEGRRLFGGNPAGYRAGRPQYPEAVYDVLTDRCGLRPRCAVLEVGPGTGMVTQRLLDAGASVVAVEPDIRMAEHLRLHVHGEVHVIESTLEDADIPERSFDLAVAATAFHWVDQEVGLRKVGRAVRPGGWVALWWLFGDRENPDEFHQAAEQLVGRTAGVAFNEPGRPPFQLDREHRLRDMRRWAGLVDLVDEYFPFNVVMTPPQARALYSSTGAVLSRPESERHVLLHAIERLAQDQFGGRVERHFLTAMYTGRRPD